MSRSAARRTIRRILLIGLLVALLGGPWPASAAALHREPLQATLATAGEQPVVDGVALETMVAADIPIHFDWDVPPEVVDLAGSSVMVALDDVPRLTGLPPFQTPVAVYLLASQERFRLALVEVAGVRVDLVADDIAGYTIERQGIMLILFPYRTVASPAGATYGFVHELTHLAEREATARRPFPQWFNEGYAEWISGLALLEHLPDQGAAMRTLHRSTVASGLHSRGDLMPWAGLVNRTRFSRAGVEGLAGLAYAQSTLFVEWLAERHGRAALAEFLVAIGQGASPTQAFESVLGPFAPQAEALATRASEVAAEIGPGIHPYTRQARPGRPIYFLLVGGVSGEQVDVEIVAADDSIVRGTETLDPAGLGLLSVDPAPSTNGVLRVLRVTTQRLGVLQIVVPDAPSEPGSGSPIQAPVQIPRVSVGINLAPTEARPALVGAAGPSW